MSGFNKRKTFFKKMIPAVALWILFIMETFAAAGEYICRDSNNGMSYRTTQKYRIDFGVIKIPPDAKIGSQIDERTISVPNIFCPDQQAQVEIMKFGQDKPSPILGNGFFEICNGAFSCGIAYKIEYGIDHVPVTVESMPHNIDVLPGRILYLDKVKVSFYKSAQEVTLPPKNYSSTIYFRVRNERGMSAGVNFDVTTAFSMQQTACDMVTPQVINVSMGSIDKSSLRIGEAHKVMTPFNIKLHCAQEADVKLMFSGQQTENYPGVLASNKTGMGVQLLNLDNNAPIAINSTPITRRVVPGENSFNLAAQYIRVGEKVELGKLYASASFNIDYN